MCPDEIGSKYGDRIMMVLVIGGSGSGKSLWAEGYVASFPGQKYYLATMHIYDEETRGRIERHRRQRSGKGFFTIEQPVDIRLAADKINLYQERTESCRHGKGVALLECIGSLAANEMFGGQEPAAEEAVVEKIVSGIASLKEELKNLVIVSNNVFEDGKVYDDTTMAYIRAMGWINERLAAMADQVVEVVAGIPVILKEEPGGNVPCTF